MIIVDVDFKSYHKSVLFYNFPATPSSSLCIHFYLPTLNLLNLKLVYGCNPHHTASTCYKGLVTNYGEGVATKRKGGMGSFTKTGGEKSFSHAERGEGTTSFGVVFMW